MQKEKLVLIDGNALLYRSFYALPSLTTTKGIPIGGAYGFTKILIKLLDKEKPDYIACTFDKGKKTFRHQRWSSYKATRPETPLQLSQQIPLTKKILEGFKISVFEEEEYEADDILATLAKEGQDRGLTIKIYTGDKDILQTISSSINVVQFKKGISQVEIFDTQKVKEKYGVFPDQIADYLSLVGDTSDNVPGVPGIGPKGAAKLIQEFDSVEEILSNVDILPPKLANKIKNNIEQVKLSKELTTLVKHIPLKFELERLKTRTSDKDKLISIFKELEFKQLIKNLGKDSLNKKEEGKEIISKDINKLIDKISSPCWIIHLETKTSGWQIDLSPYGEKIIFQLNLDKISSRNYQFKTLKKILNSEKINKIGHNLKNTIINLRNWDIQLKGIKFDTNIAAYLLNPSSSDYSLENLYIKLLGKHTNSFFSPSSKIQLIKELYPILKQELETHKMWNLFQKVEIPLIKVLVEMQLKGIKVDPRILEDCLHEIGTKRKQIEKEIYKNMGEKFNINSSKQLAKILFEKLNLPVIKKIKTGYSTDEGVLNALSVRYPYLTKILEYRHLFKLESAYIKPLHSLISPSTERIHTSFSQTTASTGRLSSFNPNLQNVPVKENLGQKIRKSFIADKGCLFISADYSQIELRLLAHLSQDKALIASFLKGEDIHRQTAAEIFNVLPLQVTSWMRRLAKRVNFGIIYGISSFGLAQNLGIPEKEAMEYIKLYFNRYPGVKIYIEETLEKVRSKGFVTTLLGRRRYIPAINSPNKRKRKLAERIAINSPIQGSAADLIKLATINIYKRLKKEELPAWIILQIHDELLFEVFQEKVDRIRKMVKKEMEQALKFSIPIVVDTKVGENWAEMKH